MEEICNQAKVEENIAIIVKKLKESNDSDEQFFLIYDLIELTKLINKNWIRYLEIDEAINVEDIHNRFMSIGENRLFNIRNNFDFNLALCQNQVTAFVNRTKVNCKSYHLNEIILKLRTLVGQVFPDDLALFDKLMMSGGLNLKKGSPAGIAVYIGSTDNNYIFISDKTIGNRIIQTAAHELGHLSQFNKPVSDNNQRRINIKTSCLCEVASSFYQILATEHLAKNNDETEEAISLLREMYYERSIINITCIVALKLYQKNDKKLYTTTSRINHLYANIICAELLEEYQNDPRAVKQKLDVIDNMIGFSNDFDILHRIGITRKQMLEQKAYKRKIKLLNDNKN